MSIIQLTIDGATVQVEAGATLLDAARSLGLEIPTLCHRGDCKPSTSCLVCVVKLGGRLVPACATKAIDGMAVESETAEVRAARRTALELLLGEHVGDCLAPCQFGCPAGMNIPRMLRQIAQGDLGGAIATIKQDIPLPAALGRICPAPCEAVCRRKPLDAAVSICQLKRYVADADLARPKPFRPCCAPASGKRVMVLGVGPSALSAAYYIAIKGHSVALAGTEAELGGRLRHEPRLPSQVLDAEIAGILALGIQHRTDLVLATAEGAELEQWLATHDAVVLACGPLDGARAAAWGLDLSKRGVAVDPSTYCTSRPGVFAIGTAVRGKCLVIRGTADGKEVAESVDQFLCGQPVRGLPEPFSSRIGKLERSELAEMAQLADSGPRFEPGVCDGTDYGPAEAAAQASRCLHCDCRAPEKCLLKRHAEACQASPKRFAGPRPPVVLHAQHPEVVFEPGKCIKCGLCIQVTAAERESLGLTFIGRGFDVRVGVPLSGALREALGSLALRCVEVCPTAALARRDEGSLARGDEAACRE